MIRVGLVDLDNAHPAYFVNLLKDTTTMRVTAVYDGGAVQPAGYAAQFATQHAVELVCGSFEELVASVDAGLVLSQNWDRHLARAQAFLEAGKPVFIDKPIVGRMCDIDSLLALAARTGAPIMGGSTMRFAAELGELRGRAAGLGAAVSAFASGPGDLLNFGSHTVDMVAGYFGPGFEAVTALSTSPSTLVQVEHRAAPPIIIQFGGGLNYPDNGCFFMLTTERSIELIQRPSGWQIGPGSAAALERFFRDGVAPLPLAAALESVQVCLAAAESLRVGRRVRLAEIPATAGFDGAAFVAEYARRGGTLGDGLGTRSQYAV